MLHQKLEELGLKLPQVAAPVAAYLPARKFGNQILVSGQLPLVDGKLLMSGPLKVQDDVEAAKAAMQQCFLNGLGAALGVADKSVISGTLKLGAFISCQPEFIWHHLVANGASDLARELFGERGRHVRFATGVPSLPLDASVELEIIFETDS